MNEQIKEMAQLMCEDCAASGGHCPTELCDDVVQQAQVLYKAGYRKQSEWISVEERLPDRLGKYLVFTCKGSIYISRFCEFLIGEEPQFDDYTVTHWMPLPEPPKGGAE